MRINKRTLLEAIKNSTASTFGGTPKNSNYEKTKYILIAEHHNTFELAQASYCTQKVWKQQLWLQRYQT